MDTPLAESAVRNVQIVAPAMYRKRCSESDEADVWCTVSRKYIHRMELSHSNHRLGYWTWASQRHFPPLLASGRRYPMVRN